MHCEKCGAPLPPGAKFCPTCGAPAGAQPGKAGPVLWESATSGTQGGTQAETREALRQRRSRFEVAPGVEYAGFWKRLVAHVIDHLVLGTVQILMHALIFTQEMQLLFSIVTSWLYYALLESSEKQATLGKMAMNLTVAREDGGAVNFVVATGRYFSKFLSGLLLGFGFIMIFFTEKRQGLHDKIMGTVVLFTARKPENWEA